MNPTPTKAPAQQHSIHPPNTPAIDGSMFGNTEEKNALENGSSSRVGSHNDRTAPNRSSGRKGNLRHRRPMNQAINPKLATNKTTAPVQRPGRSTYCPAMRNAAVTINHPTNPQANNR